MVGVVGVVTRQDDVTHFRPTAVTVEGMLGAGLDTIRQNIADADPANVLVGYSLTGEHRFSFNFNSAESASEIQEAWRTLITTGADLWFSILYQVPFKFDDGLVMFSHRLLSAAVLVGHVGRSDGKTGILGLIREKGGFVPLPAQLSRIVEGHPIFSYTYDERVM